MSHIGRVDKDSSSNSDPGMSGILCPYATIYENGFYQILKNLIHGKESRYDDE